MRSMREQIANVAEKVVNGICEFSIKIGEEARGKCLHWGAYEPKIPIELLKNEDK